MVYSLSINIVLLRYWIASAKFWTKISSLSCISAIVLANFIVLCTTLHERLSLSAACERKSLHSLDREIKFWISLAHICAFAESHVHLKRSCWIFRAWITFWRIVAEFSAKLLSNIVSIFSLGTSKITSIRSSNGHEILDW